MLNNTALMPIDLFAQETMPLHVIARRKSPVGKFERLPKWLNCIPLVAQWIWLGIRYRSISLPSAANPYITSGGMVGEGKLEYFDCMGETAKKFVAPYFAITVRDHASFPIALQGMHQNGIEFPVIVKPNLGWCGYGVRLISGSLELEEYFHNFPKGEVVILQQYLPEEGEAGLFYARYPGEKTGRIIGITLRYFPQVTGDGIHTLKQLLESDERLRRLKNNKFHQPDFDPDSIPQSGETIRLSTIGSTRVGGLYCDGGDYITPELNKAVDEIAQDMKEFYIGRFDVRYESLEKLKAGKGFTIMEVNGSGSESVNAWDPKYTIAQSYLIIFAKQRLLFRISASNRRKGHKPIGLYKLARLHFHQQKLIKLYPLSN